MQRIFCLLFTATALLLADGRTLFRSPTVSQTHIVFVYADDLWTVPIAGGEATRLTSGAGVETDPVFSPDGSMIAFTGEYDGNVDVFVVPATGGIPKRLTFHPADDEVDGWTPDGKRVLYHNNGSWVDNKPKMFTVDLNGGFPAEVPLPIGLAGSYSPDGKQLAYLPYQRADEAWKRYRGGRASTIWIANLSDSSVAAKIPRTDANDHTPMWIGNQIYFLSDRNGGKYTLFSYDPASKKVTQLVDNKALDIKAARGGAGEIAYEQFGEIHLFDVKSKKEHKVEITLNGDVGGVRRRLEKTGGRISSGSLSPTGARAVFEARGDIYTVPAEKGDVRNLTATSGAAERSPAWSPDGKWIAYFSDESGEYQLHLRDQAGKGEPKKIKLSDKPTFYYNIEWAPDSKKVTYVDVQNQAWYLEVDAAKPVRIDSGAYDGARNTISPKWSPDSQWIAYNKMLKTHLHAVYVYSLKDAKATQLTDGMSDVTGAAWDKNGKYLYFLSSTDAGPSRTGLDMTSTNRPVTSSIYVAVLQKTEASPLAPESDEEKPAAAASEEKPKKPEDKDKKVEVKIDFEGMSQRLLPLPVPARNYHGLVAGKTGVLFYLESPVVDAAFNGPESVTMQKFDLAKRKQEVFLQGVSGFDVSFNGEKVLLAQQGKWSIVPSAAPPKPGDGALRTDQMEAMIDPKAEWRQMFKEVWRIERDFFYDPKYHGLDLQAASERYGLYLNNLASRRDLNYLFKEMLGELTVGHLFVFGGNNADDAKRIRGGLLGADYKLENGRYRFARVYEGDNWSSETKAPLTQPGVNVKAGEYLLKVKGVDLRDTDNIYSRFEATAGNAIVIEVGPNADGSAAREVTVTPTASEVPLRQIGWAEDNRKRVSEASGGKLAYMHLPDTAGGGYRNFNRYYFSQVDKQGVVIDERFNHGGQAADYIIDHLRRPIWSYWTSRDGEIATTPGMIIQGPKVMLANEYSGSGGDLLPWLFKRAKLGLVVGKRTWGGLVGIGGYPLLLDGGMVTAPHFAFFSPEGKWDVENHGTDVDVDVDLDPKAWREGRDTQLEKAIEIALAELKKGPMVGPKKPEYPNYYQQGKAVSAAAGGGK